MIIRITSRNNPKLKSLLQKKSELLIFEGEKLVKDILKKGIKINQLILNESRENQVNLQNCEIGEIWYVSPPVMKKVSSLKEESDFLAVLPQPKTRIDFNRAKVIFALDNIQDPGNAGAVFRCAAAFGIDGIAMIEPCISLNNTKFLRAAQDSVFDLEFQYFNDWNSLVQKTLKKNFQLYLTSSGPVKREIPIKKIQFPCVIVIGNEGSGINNEYFEHYPSLRIEQTKKVDSLNAGISACIFMYEIKKLLK